MTPHPHNQPEAHCQCESPITNGLHVHSQVPICGICGGAIPLDRFYDVEHEPADPGRIHELIEKPFADAVREEIKAVLRRGLTNPDSESLQSNQAFVPKGVKRRTIHGPHSEGDAEELRRLLNVERDITNEWLLRWADSQEQRNRWRAAVALLLACTALGIALAWAVMAG